ncbi:MAG: flavodoxin family protein [Bacillota bacterium]|nr:flavodoxin family protein [Bacillota bacterium]
MKIMIITSSPNINGLTEACGQTTKAALKEAGAEVTYIRLNDLKVSNCHACENGFGTCSTSYSCQRQDDFQGLHSLVAEMDAYFFITPVYWGDMSESAKAFFDRLRRCEAYNKGRNNLEGKPVVCIAAAGGSGNGLLSCLFGMERIMMHLRAERFDFIGITNKTRNYKLDSIKACAAELVNYITNN